MTRRRIDTRTLQVWPGGQSYEYRGDPDGPAAQRRLRAGHYSASLRCPDHCDRVYWDKGAAYLPGHGTVAILLSDPRMGQYCIAREVAGGIAGFEIAICPTCDGNGYRKNPIKNPWRVGTADEWRAIRIELRAEMYWDRDGMGNDTSLVDDLIKAANSGELRRGGGAAGADDLAEGFEYDQLRNVYQDPSDWDAGQCQAYANDHGIDLPDVPTVDACHDPRHAEPCVHNAGACAGCTDECDEKHLKEIPDPDALEDEHGWLSEARDACRDYAQENPAEVYEWYRVSSWLCDELHAIGEVTIDNGYGHWWGRTCTGQMLLMDGTLQQVAARFEDRS